MTAYAGGALAWADGMLLEDYHDAVAFLAGGIPRASKWVDELVQQAAAATFNSLI